MEPVQNFDIGKKHTLFIMMTTWWYWGSVTFQSGSLYTYHLCTYTKTTRESMYIIRHLSKLLAAASTNHLFLRQTKTKGWITYWLQNKMCPHEHKESVLLSSTCGVAALETPRGIEQLPPATKETTHHGGALRCTFIVHTLTSFLTWPSTKRELRVS